MQGLSTERSSKMVLPQNNGTIDCRKVVVRSESNNTNFSHKTFHTKLVTKFYDYIRSKPEIVRNGWGKSLITEHIHEKIELDPFISCVCQHTQTV